MQLTSDERREVAETLRKCGAELSILGAGCETAFHVIDNAIGCQEEGSWEIFFCRLVDLIDPTCRNKQIAYNRTAPREFRTDNFICSACGETFCADGDGVNHPIDWAYCPNCGARVTGVDA